MSSKGASAMSELTNKAKSALVPRRRFPEFRDAAGWKLEPLGMLAKRSTAKNTEVEHVRVLTNSAEFGVVDQRDYFEKDIANQENLEGYYIVEKGDYVYNPRISTNAPVGPISRNNVGVGVMSPLYTVFRFINPNNDFFAHYFKSTHWHRYMRQTSSTGARHDRISITSDAFMGMPVPVAIPKEEQKVADCLSSLDELIAADEQKLKALKTNKMALVMELFPQKGEAVPRLRFPEFRCDPPWVPTKLSDVATIQSGGTPARTNPAYWGGDIPWVTTSLVDTGIILEVGEFITEAGLKESSAKVFPQGTLLMAMYGQGKTRGKVAILGIAAATNQACAAILLKSRDVSSDFVFQSLNGRYKEIRKISNSGGQANLSAGLIENIPLSYPRNKDEQEKISFLLSSFDELVRVQAEKVERLRIWKKGLMQELFPVPNEVQE